MKGILFYNSGDGLMVTIKLLKLQVFTVYHILQQ